MTVIVVTYNASTWVPRCFEALGAGGRVATTETVVVDNASTEFGLDDLRTWAGPAADVVRLPENVGFAAGVNYAAKRSTGRHLLLLNPDALIEPGSIDALLELHRSNPAISIVGGRVTTPDGDLDRGSCFGFQTLWSLFCFGTGLSTAFPMNARLNPEGLGTWQRDSVRRVGVVTGCLLLIDRETWDHLGGFDEQLFMYGEDADLCARAARLGREAWITPQARVTHGLGASSSVPLRKQTMLFRGKASLARKGFSGARLTFALTCLRAGVGLRALGEVVTRTDRGSWRGLWAGRRSWLSGW